MLTFDDGLLDNYTKVFPLLLEFGMVATFYVVPGYDKVTRYVNPWSGGWSDFPQPLYSLPFYSMQSQHRQEMSRHGMEIGCHTFNHRKLTQVPSVELRHEIADSKIFLEDELGQPVTTFCYPNGRFDRRVLAQVKEAGYLGACSTLPGYYKTLRHPYLLNRFLVEGHDLFEATLRGRFFHPATLARLVKGKLFPT